MYAISDIHLSFGTENKNMNIFRGWNEYESRLKANWNGTVADGDTVVIGGDISWGMSLERALPDFRFIANELNGNKIILKGNHDYWWMSLTKMRGFLRANGISNIDFLHNNAYKVGNTVVCGTRGWIAENIWNEPDEKILQREAGRLETSIKAGIALGGEIAVFLHYPPVYADTVNHEIMEIIGKYSIKRVFSGHIHLSGMGKAFTGYKNGTYFDMITADSLGFSPKKI